MESLDAESAIGIVVPIHNDTDAVTKLLRQIAGWRDQPAEITIVSSQPPSELGALGATHDCRLIHCAANRGEQLDRGARATSTPILWFLHADAEPSEDSLAAIRAAIAGSAPGGCLRFEFQGPRTWYKRGLERLIALRVRGGGIPYGDQGLFATRAAYLATGGFAHQPLFEEVGFVRGLRKHGRFRVLRVPIRVATRRWDRDGWWRRTWHNRWLATCYAFGVSAQRLAGSYHRGGRTTRATS
jgi:rSAM/selenodomain-associated transferase 2